jgi:predicted transcriptional regulator
MPQAHRFAYTEGLDLSAPPGVVPVGITCRQCPRDCAQRAFDRIAVAPAVVAVTG